MGRGIAYRAFGAALVIGLFACSPARFVEPAKEPRHYVPGGVPGAPETFDRLSQKFVWKKVSGDLNVAFVLHVHPANERAVFDRLNDFAAMAGEGILKFDSDNFRTNFLIEKETGLKSAGPGWRTIQPKLITAAAQKTILREQIDRLQQSARDTDAENFPADPFASLERVRRSLAIAKSPTPSFFHLVYLRDRDLYLTTDAIAPSRERLRQTLNAAPLNSRFTSVSLLSFQDRDSACRPRESERGINLAQFFGAFFGHRGELCNLPGTDLRSLVDIWRKEQGKVILNLSPQPGTLVVKVDGVTIPGDHFFYHADSREILFWGSAEPRVGAVVEVSYEAAR